MSSTIFKQGQSKIDSLFVNWNKTTLHSLERQFESSTDSVRRSLYANRLLAFNAYLGIKTPETVNVNSIRYKFLTELSNVDKGSFYIVEANESGQKVLLRNFILYPSSDIARVEFYIYEGAWKKKGLAELKNFSLKNNLKDYLAQKGFNYDDIIITKFENGTIKESEYFLFGTLSLSSGIKSVLDSYRKENFISN